MTNQYSVKLIESLKDINKEEWNSILKNNNIICSYNFLLAVEESKINQCRFFYPIVYKNNKIVAHTCFYLIDTYLDIFAVGWQKTFISFIRKIWPSFLILKFIECGTPVAIGNTITIQQNEDSERILKIFSDQMNDIGKKHRVKIQLFRDFYENEIFYFQALEKFNFIKVHNLSDASFENHWDTFDNYIDSMRSKYRQNCLKYLKPIKNRLIDVEVVNDFSEYSEKLAELWQNVNDNAKEYKREQINKIFFEKLNERLPENTEITLFKERQNIIAFVLNLIDENTLKPMYLGIDYTSNNNYNLYHNCLISIIDTAIRLKKKNIVFGITSLEPKSALGCKIVPLYMYMRHPNIVMNKIYGFLFKIMTPQETDKNKRVFR